METACLSWLEWFSLLLFCCCQEQNKCFHYSRNSGNQELMTACSAVVPHRFFYLLQRKLQRTKILTNAKVWNAILSTSQASYECRITGRWDNLGWRWPQKVPVQALAQSRSTLGLDQAAQGLDQMGLGNLQGWRRHNLSKQTVLSVLVGNSFSLHSPQILLVSVYCTSHLTPLQHWANPGSIFSITNSGIQT